MNYDETTETPTLKRLNVNTFVQLNEVFARAAGDSCEAGQEGHEWAEGAGYPILKCTEVSTGVFRWVDTGRVRS